MLWNHDSELSKKIEAPECDPNMADVMDGKLIVAEKWIQAFDLNIT